MKIHVQLTKSAIETLELSEASLGDGAGARVEFRGVVRGEEAGRPILALDYEAYGGMAERVMRELIEELGRRHGVLAVSVIHRVGRIPVGAAAILVVAYARHRAEAFALVTEFMDRLKVDVPIWKRGGVEAEGLVEARRSTKSGHE